MNLPGGHYAAPSAHDLPTFAASAPSPARIWDYWLGGKDNFAADRQVAEEVLDVMPTMPAIARATRRFLVTAVRLATDNGIRQFLDIGAGLPTVDNTHEVAQRAAPESRIVYADYDPVVLTHARALLTGTPEGRTGYVQADLRDTGIMLTEAAQSLDFTRPVAVLLLAVLHFIPEKDDPYGAVVRLMDAVPPGSFLAIVHSANDIMPGAVAEGVRRYNAKAAEPLTPRTHDQVSRFFTGLDLISPGLVTPAGWDREQRNSLELPCYCGIARKPGDRW